MTTKTRTSLFAAALFSIAANTPAQTIYTKVDAGGQVTLTELPSMTSQPEAETAPSLDVTNAPAKNSAISSRRAATINANEAARRLGQAQLKRKQGAEPLPGEQAQGAGASAVNHRYWRRQEKLRRVVEQAQRRSNETHGPLLARR